MRVPLHELRNGFRRIPRDQLNLWHMTKKAILIVDADQFQKFVVTCGLKIPWRGDSCATPVFMADRRKPAKTVKSIDPPRQVFRLKDRAQLCPCHHTKSPKDAALDNGTLDGQDQLEDLVHGQEALQVLSPHVLREILQFRLNTVWAIHKDVF